MQCIGVRGTAEAMNVKKAVLAMLTVIDTVTKRAKNRALLNELAPHSTHTDSIFCCMFG